MASLLVSALPPVNPPDPAKHLVERWPSMSGCDGVNLDGSSYARFDGLRSGRLIWTPWSIMLSSYYSPSTSSAIVESLVPSLYSTFASSSSPASLLDRRSEDTPSPRGASVSMQRMQKKLTALPEVLKPSPLSAEKSLQHSPLNTAEAAAAATYTGHHWQASYRRRIVLVR